MVDLQAAAALGDRIQLAYHLHRSGDPVQAGALCEQILRIQPRHFSALQLLGVLSAQTGDPKKAADLFAAALKVEPADALTWSLKGVAHQELGQWNAALRDYDRALALRPGYAEVHSNRGNVLMELEQWRAALVSFDRAIAARPGFAGVYSNRGNALKELKDWEGALSSYDRAIAIDPNFADAWSNRGNVLMELKAWEAALASFDRAVAIRADFAVAHYNRGNVLRELGRHEAAVSGYDRAVALNPRYTNAFHNRGNALLDLRRHEAAIASYDRALELEPELRFLPGIRRHAQMYLCDWQGLDADVARLAGGIRAGREVTPPFPLLALVDSAPLHKAAARIWARKQHAPDLALPAIARRAPHEKIRIGYFSTDFHDHPVARLMAELLERHDRTRFEITAFSFGRNGEDEMRARVRKSVDRFVDVTERSDRDVALLARSLEIDVAIDLGGFTQGSRPKIFALRAAPVQVGYLGYPGTLGAPHMDYLVADAVVVPAECRGHYDEKLISLPHCFLPAGGPCAMAGAPATREQCGLPAEGFVFCCFNNSYKIVPAVFAAWMRILQRTDGSVLWLADSNAACAENLRREAADRGVDAWRLIFAAWQPSYDAHLARLRLADLFIDTWPYNAHATAIDALWVGVPVVTRTGEAFAGRVAASLLTAAGLPELITSTPELYEELAVSLAARPERLREHRQRLAQSRLTSALFDTRHLTRCLEWAYSSIHQRRLEGLPTEDLVVPGTTGPDTRNEESSYGDAGADTRWRDFD